MIRYLWAAPTTALGLVVALGSVMTGGRARVVQGIIEVHGGAARWLLTHAVPLRGGADAMTLGHVVLGRTATALDSCRAHEHVHVRQCERWGPAFVPAYAAAGLWALISGGHAYRDNWFERDARAGARARPNGSRRA